MTGKWYPFFCGMTCLKKRNYVSIVCRWRECTFLSFIFPWQTWSWPFSTFFHRWLGILHGGSREMILDVKQSNFSKCLLYTFPLGSLLWWRWTDMRLFVSLPLRLHLIIADAFFCIAHNLLSTRRNFFLQGSWSASDFFAFLWLRIFAKVQHKLEWSLNLPLLGLVTHWSKGRGSVPYKKNCFFVHNRNVDHWRVSIWSSGVVKWLRYNSYTWCMLLWVTMCCKTSTDGWPGCGNKLN